jgi:putative transposase
VCRPTLYNWKNQVLDREASASMKQYKDPEAAPKQNIFTELQQHVALLERDIRRLQLEHDLLRKANELLKKGLDVAPQLL